MSLRPLAVHHYVYMILYVGSRQVTSDVCEAQFLCEPGQLSSTLGTLGCKPDMPEATVDEVRTCRTQMSSTSLNRRPGLGFRV